MLPKGLPSPVKLHGYILVIKKQRNNIYIKHLQADNVLNDDLEKLELEELSGVAGLKALRVGVNLED